MKPIIIELFCRGQYAGITAACVWAFFYLTQGLQLEYFSGIFISHCQNVEFHFYESLQNDIINTTQPPLPPKGGDGGEGGRWGSFRPEGAAEQPTKDCSTSSSKESCINTIIVDMSGGSDDDETNLLCCGGWNDPPPSPSQTGWRIVPTPQDGGAGWGGLLPSVGTNPSWGWYQPPHPGGQPQDGGVGTGCSADNGFIMLASYNQSKSWSYLFISTCGYFNCLKLNSFYFFTVLTLFWYFQVILFLEVYALLAPGFLNSKYLKTVTKFYSLFLIFISVNPYLALLVISVWFEFSIELVDSELENYYGTQPFQNK